MQPLKLQPIPYQGSKRQLAPRICKLFPKKVDTLFEPFCGSAAITVYAASHNLAKHYVIGDSLPELVELWRLIINKPDVVVERYREVWGEQHTIGPTHFNNVRTQYNETREPVLLLYLVARCVKNAVRFNKTGSFTQSVDKRRTGVQPDKLEHTIRRVSSLLNGKTTLYSGDFVGCIEHASSGDLVYMDPPYQGTTYGKDKRYAEQLERDHLISCLRDLNKREVQFILSYDGTTGEKVYAEPLPIDLECVHLDIHAGRSSQATLAGRDEDTIESLYVSKLLAGKSVTMPDYSQPVKQQADLFS